MNDPRQHCLLKKGHTYLFRYHPGDESALIAVLLDRAADKDHPFDWFDAAIISHQMGPASAREMQRRLRDAQLKTKG